MIMGYFDAILKEGSYMKVQGYGPIFSREFCIFLIYFGGFLKIRALSDTESLNFGRRNTAKVLILLTLILL